MNNSYIKLTLLLYLSLCANSIVAQDINNNVKLFTSISIHQRINANERFTLSYNDIRDINSLSLRYSQLGIRYRFRLKKRLYLKFKTDFLQIQSRSGESVRQGYRFGLSVYGLHRINKAAITQGLEYEYFLPKFRKYQSRIIYHLDFTYRWDVTDWRLRPYSKVKLYYYSGVDSVRYYDAERDLIATNNPDGFHRWRLYLGLKMRPSKSIRCSVSFLVNQEFNTNIGQFSGINIPNKKETRVQLPFNNYTGWVLSLNYLLK